MAATAIKTEEEKREFFDSPADLDNKVEQLAMMILASEHFVAFTGAGLSTGAGIPDYRSGVNTVLKTGPGCWEKAATIQNAVNQGHKIVQIPQNQFGTTIRKAMPTKSHMAMVKLMEMGFLKHVISQNVDGLHRKSGIPADKLTEVHGNTNLEICKTCGRDYMRDYGTRKAGSKEHLTGRMCDDPKCGGPLQDSIVNFGENLREKDLDTGFNHGYAADLMLSVGTSMRVPPACEMAEETFNRGGKLVIINLQNCPQTPMAAFQIYAQIDTVFELLMKKLDIVIPKFELKRYANARLEQRGGKEYLTLESCDLLGGPFEVFKKVNINNEDRASVPLTAAEKKADAVYKIKTTFMGYYNEPELEISLPRAAFIDGLVKLNMNYNPFTGKWQFVASICSFSNEVLNLLPYKNIGAIKPLPEIIRPAAVPIKPTTYKTDFKTHKLTYEKK